MADLHSDQAQELMDVSLFLEGLRARFEDDTRVQVAEGELIALKQRGRPAKKFVKEFKRLAGWVRAWPEHMLVHQFHLGLDRELRQACVYRGLPSWLSTWCKAVIELDTGLREFHVRGSVGGVGPSQPRRMPPERPPVRDISKRDSDPQTGDLTRCSLRCFCCDHVGHRALECPLPPVQPPVAKSTPSGGRG